MDSPRRSLLQVTVIEDDVGALSTKLEGDVLDVRVGGALHDPSADNSASGECDLLDAHVAADGLADSGTVTVDNIKDTGGEASLVGQLGEETRWRPDELS